MPNLHIINKSSFDSTRARTALARAATDDAVIFIENGVYCALDLTRVSQHANSAINFFALREDVLARGLESKINDVQLIDYDGFVSLTLTYDRVISWY